MYKQKMITLGVLATLCILASMSMQARAQGQEGMVVVKDEKTGRMRAPTPEELRTLRAKTPPAASLNATPHEQRLTSRRDGAKGVRLGDKSLVYEVVTRDANGKLDSQCVQGEAAARDAMEHTASKHKEHAHEAR